MNAPENRSLRNKGPGIGPLPIGEFYTPEYFDLEKEHIFKKSWLRLATVSKIPNVGDYFVQELDACDTSLIVVRGRDNKIRAFHNMCSHRSNRVAYEPKGNTNSFKCSFHSWAYGLDGSLRAVPEENLFPGLDKTENGLTEIACEIWEDFIFVNVDPKPTQTLREYLGEEVYNGYNGHLTKFVPVFTVSAVMHANWKLCLDAFVETYHFSTVHLPTAGDIILSRDFPNGKIDAVRLYEKHRIASATTNLEHTPTFAETLARKYSGGGATLAPDVSKKMTFPPQINPKSLPDWVTDILVVFPMCNIQQFQGFYMSQDYWPLSHDRTQWSLTVHMIPPQNAAQEVAAEYSRIFTCGVIREDLKNLKMVQSNLNSGAKKYQQLGNMETMVRHSYKVVAEQVGSGW